MSTVFRVSIPRKVISARLPIGVGTKNIEDAAGSSDMDEVYRSHAGPEDQKGMIDSCCFTCFAVEIYDNKLRRGWKAPTSSSADLKILQ